MNQILITKKLYITPELKRKKKVYKVNFILSIFLVCVLTSMYIYAEYDRNRSEAVSQSILEEMNEIIASTTIEEDTTIADSEILLVVLDGTVEDYETIEEAEEAIMQARPDISEVNLQAEMKTSASGYNYKTIATINIPKINVNYPVLLGKTGSAEETEALLKISPLKYHGCEPNEVGNFCIVAHNYRNTKFFSKVPTLVVGDTIQLTDLTGRTITYSVYDKHTVDPNDTRDTSQLTGGKKEVTLITCTDDSKARVIVKCKEVK